ncbi:hypothetical protein [Burkholderia multivorans]|uniref:hypothetical protein n=1 Tax=Burkholderia multivorans TaxID=87883 RepID=UPI00286293F7|nr:hypothetical protein [Burkholderia multivorans]MDR8920499.1 hypothetical protein [Burkholderia multivorans]MDR8921904.1 hypothetical protein [Burkholderia multivorans]MDR8965965.1 hypothetical protein [Burkholderia multivorans]MDR8988561.1 hypothetical protein [Burkholderia multivorans]MDR9019560.1 hypothetical protein [Burkholderia multivorans]
MTDPNHDIVPTLRMFDGVMTGLAADEIERLRKRVAELEAGAQADAREPKIDAQPEGGEIAESPVPQGEVARSVSARVGLTDAQMLMQVDDELRAYLTKRDRERAVSAMRRALAARAAASHQGQPEPRAEVTEADLIALLPGTYYMDPPDGGDVSLLEQLRRMAADAGRYRWMRAHYTRFVALPDDGPELDLQAIGEIGDAYEGQVLDQTVDAASAQGGES